MRSKAPLWGTPVGSLGMSSLMCWASLLKSTSAWKGLMLPAARACDWACSRHHDGSVLLLELGVPGTGSCALKRNATSKNAGGDGIAPAPPASVALAVARGSRYLLLAASHSPTPAARRTVEEPGFHSLWGTSTVI